MEVCSSSVSRYTYIVGARSRALWIANLQFSSLQHSNFNIAAAIDILPMLSIDVRMNQEAHMLDLIRYVHSEWHKRRNKNSHRYIKDGLLHRWV